MTGPVRMPPAVIVLHPDEPPEVVKAICELALSEQRAPIALHRSAMPWLYDETGHPRPVASPWAGSILSMVARHTAGQMWIILRDDEPDLRPNMPYPRWAEGAARLWRDESRSRKGSRRCSPATFWLEKAEQAGVLLVGDAATRVTHTRSERNRRELLQVVP